MTQSGRRPDRAHLGSRRGNFQIIPALAHWHPHCIALNMSPHGISYQARAEECRRRAAAATWPPDRLGWTELAQAWLRLSQSADFREPSGSALNGSRQGVPCTPINPKLAFAAFETNRDHRGSSPSALGGIASTLSMRRPSKSTTSKRQPS